MENVKIWQFVVLLGIGFITGFISGERYGYSEGVQIREYVKWIQQKIIKEDEQKLSSKKVITRNKRGRL